METTRRYLLSEEECLTHGGHEYETPATMLVFGPPQCPRYTRTCRYCGHTQHGYQPDIVWES